MTCVSFVLIWALDSVITPFESCFIRFNVSSWAPYSVPRCSEHKIILVTPFISYWSATTTYLIFRKFKYASISVVIAAIVFVAVPVGLKIFAQEVSIGSFLLPFNTGVALEYFGIFVFMIQSLLVAKVLVPKHITSIVLVALSAIVVACFFALPTPSHTDAFKQVVLALIVLVIAYAVPLLWKSDS